MRKSQQWWWSGAALLIAACGNSLPAAPPAPTEAELAAARPRVEEPPEPEPVRVPDPPEGADPRAVERMNEYSAERIALGYVPHGNPEAGSLRRRGSARYTTTLAAGDCYTLAAFGGRGVRDLDIFLKAPSGRRIAKDVLRDSRPIVNTCVQETGPYTAQVLMYAGSGPFTFQIYRNPGAAATAVGIAGIDPRVKQRMDRLSGRLASRGFRPLEGAAGAGSLERKQQQSFDVEIPEGGRCYAFTGFAGTGMRDLDISVHNAQGLQLGKDVSRSATADVYQFVGEPGNYKIVLFAYAGSGAFAYQIYQRGAGQPCP